MKRQRTKTAGWAAVAVFLLAGAAFAGWWDDVAEAEPVQLAEVVKDPFAYKGKEVTFTCVFHSVSKFYNPYYTRFLPSMYVNFSVWPATARLWDKREYVASHPFCFLERDHESFSTLMELDRFTKLKLTGYVQNTFKSMPWIEVRHIEVLDAAVTKDTLRLIIQGDQAAERGDWDVAVAHYADADISALPEEVGVDVAKKRCRALVMAGRHRDAADIIEDVLEIVPRDSEALALLTEVNDALGTRIQPPALVEADPPAEALPVEPERYPPPVEAMPAPGTGWDQYTPPVRHTPVYRPKSGTPPPSLKAPEEEPVDEAPRVEPEVEPREELPEPARQPTPKKRMSGPM